MGTKKGKGMKFTRCFKAPFRFLIKARDFYVRAMSDWAARLEKCSGGYAAAQFSIHPDSYSFHSSRNSAQNEELMELMRAVSARNQSNRVDDKSEILRRSPCVKSPTAGGFSWQADATFCDVALAQLMLGGIVRDGVRIYDIGVKNRNEFEHDAAGIEAILIVCKGLLRPDHVGLGGAWRVRQRKGLLRQRPILQSARNLEFRLRKKFHPNEDLTELVRAASARNLSKRVQSEILQRPRHVKLPAASRRSLRWTRSVGIGRIEEDRPCEFGQEVTVETRHVEYGRRRNCIVSKS
ncbi:hypothetical protein C3L33_18514, partial [Rhododendron williamsianum]